MDAFTKTFLKNLSERMELDEETIEVFTECIKESWVEPKASTKKASGKRKSGGRNKYHLFLAKRKADGVAYSDALAEWKEMSDEDKAEFKPEPSDDASTDGEEKPKKKRTSTGKVNPWTEYLKVYRAECKEEGKKFAMADAKEGYPAWKEEFEAKHDVPEEANEEVDEGETTEEEEVRETPKMKSKAKKGGK